MDMKRMTDMKRSKLRLAVALALVLTLLLALAPTAWAEEKGTSWETAYVYDENNKNDIVDMSYTEGTGVDLNQVIFGAFASWVNTQLKKEEVTKLYIKIGADLYTDRNDKYRHSITIPEGKSLHLQLSGCKVGNDHSVTCVDEPYFLVEPGGELEITGNGRIINTEVTKDGASIQDHALILNYGTTEISGTIFLERKYKHTGYPHTDEFSRQHTIINYGTLEITGPESGVGASIDVLSTAAGEYDGKVYVGETTVENADVKMATVFVEEDTGITGTDRLSVEMTNVNIYYAFGFVGAENVAGGDGSIPSSVGSFPLVGKESESDHYYHKAVDVPAKVTLEKITWKDGVNDNSDACGVLLLNSPSAEVQLKGAQTNLKPVIVGGQTEATVATLQNRTFLTLTLADVEDSITISGAVVESTGKRGGYIKLNNSKNVTLDNCTADAIILADGYLRDDNIENLAPNDDGSFVVDVGLPSGSAGTESYTTVTLVDSTINSVHLYQNNQTYKRTVGLTIQSGVYGFTQKELESEMKKKYDGKGSVVMDGVKAQATVTVDGDTKNIYAESNEKLLDLINKQEPQADDTVEITKAQEDLVLSDYPAGVKVVNNSGVTITVNNKELESGKDYTVCYIQANVIVDGVRTVINANDNEELLAEIQKLNPQAGDTVEITAAEEGLVLAGYPAGVKVVNSSDVTIKVNNKELKKGVSYTVYYAPIAGIVVDQGEGGQTEDGQTEEVYYLVTCDTLNVRSGAGTQYGKLGTLSRGTKLTGQMENGWLKFSYEGQTAYCCGDYLQKATGTPDGLTVICRTLNVRSGPGTSYSKIGTLSRGTFVDVLETLEGWYKIAFGDGEGYVSALYLG